MASTIESLHWRYATKQYDPTKKLSEEQRHLIMEALRLAPSSFGLQPYKFVHVTDAGLREKLKAAAYNQPQLTDASDIFVLCSYAKIDEAYVDSFIDVNVKARNVTAESLKGLRDMLVGSVKGRSEQDLKEWNARQVYIPLGVALATAAENRIDATPMEGFNSVQFDEILGLKELGLLSRVILAVGFRSTDDKYQALAKARFPERDIFIER